MAFDLPGEVFRHESYADYKANRPPAPEDLNVQVPYAKRGLRGAGRRRSSSRQGYEADDLIATYARKGREAGMRGRRRRLGQGPAAARRRRRGGAEPVEEPAARRRGRGDRASACRPERVRDVLGLMGDSVDNIPGVPGVGEKTALAVGHRPTGSSRR